MDMEATPEMSFSVPGARSQISQMGEITDPVLKSEMEKFLIKVR